MGFLSIPSWNMKSSGNRRRLRFAASFSRSESTPSIFSAVKHLGLKLEPGKGPVQMLVVDSIEKTPTEN